MSLEDAVRRSVEGLAGKLLLSSAIALIMAGIGWTHNEISAHSTKLSTIDQKLDDLIIAEDTRAQMQERRAAVTDAAVGKLADTEQQHSIAIARAEDEIEAMRQAPRIERETIQVPQPLPAIGNALSHIIPGLQPHRQWRRRP